MVNRAGINISLSLISTVQTAFFPFIPFALPSALYSLPYRVHRQSDITLVTARQSYHSPLPVSHPHFQSVPSAHPKRSIPLTVLKLPPPPPIPRCRCLPTSTSAQHLRFVRRKAYCRKWSVHSGLLQTTRMRSNGRALSPHARSCRFPRMKPFTALF